MYSTGFAGYAMHCLRLTFQYNHVNAARRATRASRFVSVTCKDCGGEMSQRILGTFGLYVHIWDMCAGFDEHVHRQRWNLVVVFLGVFKECRLLKFPLFFALKLKVDVFFIWKKFGMVMKSEFWDFRDLCGNWLFLLKKEICILPKSKKRVLKSKIVKLRHIRGDGDTLIFGTSGRRL